MTNGRFSLLSEYYVICNFSKFKTNRVGIYTIRNKRFNYMYLIRDLYVVIVV